MLFKSDDLLRDFFGSRLTTRARSARNGNKHNKIRGATSPRRLQLESLEQRALLSVTIGTNLPDYAPGSTALIDGTGFTPGETVQLQVAHVDGTPALGGTPWQVVDGDTSFTTPYQDAGGIWHSPDLDGKVDGNIQTSWYVNPIDETDATMQLTATGLSSGDTATTTFTDRTLSGVSVGAQSSSPITPGSSATFPITITSSSSGTVSVALSVTSALPTGATANFLTTPISVTTNSNTADSLTISTTASTPAGHYSFTVQATAGATTKTSTGTLIVGPTVTLSPASINEGSADFTLTVSGVGTTFNSSEQVLWNGVALSTTYDSSTGKLKATVPAADVSDEGTASISVSGVSDIVPKTFAINDADVVAATTGYTFAPTETVAYNNAIATFTDTYKNASPSEFKVTSVNWGDGTTTTNPAATIAINNTTGLITVSGVSHTYSTYYAQTAINVASNNVSLPPASGTIYVAHNGTANFASSGTLTIFTSSGYQTVTYTGKTTGAGTSADSFTGVTGGSGTLVTGSPVTQAYHVSVTLAPVDADETWTPVTATSAVNMQDPNTYVPSAGNFSITEGASYTGSSFFPGSVYVSSFPTSSDYRMKIDPGNGNPVAWYTVYTSGPNNYLYPLSTTGTLSFPEEGSTTYTETLYRNNGVQAAQASGTITIYDASLGYYSAINNYNAVEGSPTATIQVGKFLDYNPNDHHGDFTVTVHWGDGSSSVVPAVFAGNNTSNQATYTISSSHTYAEENVYTVTYDVSDNAAGGPYDAHNNPSNPGNSTLTGISTATVTVSDPAVVAANVPTIVGEAGVPIGSKALATFTDPGGAEANDGTHYSATVNWGGSFGSSTGTITFAGGTFIVSAVVPYTAIGTYSPVVTINHESSTSQLVHDSVTVADTTPPTVTDFRVLYGAHGSYSLLGSSRLDLPWQITGIQVVFSENVIGAQNSLIVGGATVTGFSGSGTNTLTWSVNTLTLGSFAATLATGTMSGAITDIALNSLMSAPNTSQSFKVLYGDVTGDGVVNSADGVAALGGYNASSPYYHSVFADLDGDGLWTANDVTIARLRLGAKL